MHFSFSLGTVTLRPLFVTRLFHLPSVPFLNNIFSFGLATHPFRHRSLRNSVFVQTFHPLPFLFAILQFRFRSGLLPSFSAKIHSHFPFRSRLPPMRSASGHSRFFLGAGIMGKLRGPAQKLGQHRGTRTRNDTDTAPIAVPETRNR